MITFLKNKNEFLIFFIIGFFVFATTGNYISDYVRLIFIKLLLIFLISREVSLISEVKKKFSQKNSITVLIILFFISITISFIFSPLDINQSSIEWSGIRYIHSITNILMFISFLIFFSIKKINYSYLINSILISGLIISLYIILIYIIKFGISSEGKMTLFFGNTRQLGLYMTFLICFSIADQVNAQRNFSKLIFLLPIFLSIIILLGNRGSLISLFITFLFLLIILKFLREKILKILFVFLFSLFLSFLIKEFSFYLSNLNSNDIINYNHSFEVLRADKFSFDDRIEQWKYGFEIFKENLFFGLGSNGFAISALNEKHQTGYPIFAFYSHPHNLIIQFLVEWGLIGTLLILLLLGKLFYSSIKYLILKKEKIILIPGLSIIALSVHGLVDGSYYHPITSFYLVLSFSLLSAEIMKK